MNGIVLVRVIEASGDATYDQIVMVDAVAMGLTSKEAATAVGRIVQAEKDLHPDDYQWNEIEQALEAAGFLVPALTVCEVMW